MPEPTLVTRVAAFVGGTSGEPFGELALAGFAFQLERIEPYRRLCAARAVAPERVRSWREVPAVPAEAFRSLALHAAPPREVFRSSGTLGTGRSVHHHPYPELYRKTLDAAFPAFCLPSPGRLPILSLIPTRAQLPDSSLAFMAEHVLERWGDDRSRVAFGERGVEVENATVWAEQRQRAGRPCLVLATAFALLQWLDALAAAGTRPALPAGSVLMETGGFKGRTREVTRDELLAGVEAHLGVPRSRVVREYGMTELTGQLYSRPLAGGDPELLVAPPWMRVRALDPASLEELAPGEPGLVAIFDLANLGSAVHLLTQDLGVVADGGLRLLGRASEAELRGCSLSVEELAWTPPC